MHWWNYLADLFYPRLCMSCERQLMRFEPVLCSYCEAHLPQTHFHHHKENPVEVLFWGRCEVFRAAAYYRYLKSGKVQHLIHNFKYKGFREIGHFVGEKYGVELSISPDFADISYIIPVPLHPKRQRHRGFNQSEEFGKGLAKSMTAVLDAQNLVRAVHTTTQTRKSRWERYKNVSEIFVVNDIPKLENQHVLLVDDVITTGSTIEACVQTLKQVPGIRVSVVAMATAAH